MKDTYRHKGLRKKMIERLRADGIAHEHILAAMMEVPRHFFMDADFDIWAYEDQPFSIGSQQTISQPTTVAQQTALLDIKKHERVLEIGTGSGYQAAILSTLGARVFTVERQTSLYKKTFKLLNSLYPSKINCFLGDGMVGLPNFAPFDAILFTAGAETLPKNLVQQLAVGGRIVIPIGVQSEKLVMHRYTKQSDESLKVETFGNYRFVPLLPGIEI